MPKTKRQKQNEQIASAVAYIKALSGEMGYTQDYLSKRLGISAVTLRKRYRDPKQFTVAEINKLCQMLPIDEEFELKLRGVKL